MRMTLCTTNIAAYSTNVVLYVFILCEPLSGVAYKSDHSKAYQSLVYFTTGKPSEDWLQPVAKFKNGRNFTQALEDNFSGEGNTSCRESDIDSMTDTLYYKKVRSLPFQNLFTKVQ